MSDLGRVLTCDECAHLHLGSALGEQGKLDGRPAGHGSVGVDGEGHQHVGHGLLQHVHREVEVGYLARLESIRR